MTGLMSSLNRYRIKFTKQGDLKYIGHLDLHRIWERSFRRARLPLAYSQGFHPQPKIQLASALPLGYTSLCELGDFWLECPADLQYMAETLKKALPDGIEIRRVKQVDLAERPLQVQITAARYRVEILPSGQVERLEGEIQRVLGAEALPRIKKNNPYNLRPLILELAAIPGENRLEMLLSAREGATGRPEEVLVELGLDPLITRIERIELILVDQ